MTQSSITSSSMAAGVSRTWCLVGTRDAKRSVPSSASLPRVTFMVRRDHGTTSGSTEAFFNESIRREAMIGTRTVFALETHIGVNTSCLKARSASRKRETYITGKS